jgi:phosphatidylserine decarboxylase
MKDALIISALSLVPKHAVAGWMGRFARLELPAPFRRLLLRAYVWKYNVDLSECEGTIDDYPSLVAFFTRALRAGVRPVDTRANAIVSPCDGKVYAVGTITNDVIPQSESQHFSAIELLAGKIGYEGGQYAVIYLSPRDYHRVHVPREGTVTRFQYVPGALWPVFPAATRSIPFLFSRNERLTAFLDTDCGEVAEVMVGAFGVGRMRVVFNEIITNQGGKTTVEQAVSPAMALARAAELGRFEMGSTVVLLFPPGRIRWTVHAGQAVKLGEQIGEKVDPVGLTTTANPSDNDAAEQNGVGGPTRPSSG